MDTHGSAQYLAHVDMPDGVGRTLYRYPNGFGARLDYDRANDRAVMTVIKWRGDFYSDTGSVETAGLQHPVGETFDVPTGAAQAFRFLKIMLREIWDMPAMATPDASGQWQAYAPG
ncbi:hypothetical protein [Micromonospora chalcea]|uniref:hypothetical protein n=1 Tax=Micromonospora chalcea TaxID=1874 RepID=UPI003D7429B1